MKRLWVVLSIAVALGLASLLMMPSRGFAQDAGAAKSSPDQAPSATEEPPPGGCMPIGVTASGEIVFPFLCKGFIDRHKAADQRPAPAEQSQKSPVAAGEPRPGSDAERKTSDQQPTATDQSGEKPVTAQGEHPASDAITGSTDEKSSVKQPESPPPEIARPMLQQIETAPAQRAERDKPRERRSRREDPAGPPGCTHFRSYDRASGTYTDFSGRRRDCRA